MPSASPHTPLWSRLAQALAREIAEGKRPVGSLLPTEQALTALYSVSRHTVRAALAELVNRGLIERHPHIGSRVISDGREPRFYMEPGEYSDLDRFAQHYPRFLLSSGKSICDKTTSSLTGFAEQTPLIRLEYTRRDASSPRNPLISYTVTWIRDISGDVLAAGEAHPDTPLINVLERITGVRCMSIRQSFCGTGLSDYQAKILNLREGAPAMLVVREFLDARRRPLIVARNLFPQASYTYRITIRRQAEY
jgi:GntR family transcriptional regulator